MKQCGRVVKNHGGKMLVHICGDTSDRLDSVLDIGSDIFSIDYQVNLKKAKQIIDDKVTLLGNLSPSVLYNGNPAVVKRACRTCIKNTVGERFILGAGCDIAPGTSIENIEVWKDTTRFKH
jgi:uroporphyrinogen-III decarboxylase